MRKNSIGQKAQATAKISDSLQHRQDRLCCIRDAVDHDNPSPTNYSILLRRERR